MTSSSALVYNRRAKLTPSTLATPTATHTATTHNSGFGRHTAVSTPRRRRKTVEASYSRRYLRQLQLHLVFGLFGMAGAAAVVLRRVERLLQHPRRHSGAMRQLDHRAAPPLDGEHAAR